MLLVRVRYSSEEGAQFLSRKVRYCSFCAYSIEDTLLDSLVSRLGSGSPSNLDRGAASGGYEISDTDDELASGPGISWFTWE